MKTPSKIRIPYGRQMIDDDDVAAVSATLRSDYLTTGPAVAQFEEQFASYVGSPFAVAMSSGTAALHAAMVAAGVGPGTDVITSPMSFVATANSVLYAGGTPVFADIDPETMNLSVERLREVLRHDYAHRDSAWINRKTGSRLQAIAVVHFAGLPCRMDRIGAFAAEHGLVVVEDSAHALGAEYAQPLSGRVGSRPGHLACFSTHPVKHITTGEGGMVTTSDPETRDRLVRFRNHGITTGPQERAEQDAPWFYEMTELGYNYRLSDIHAALGASQLKKADRFLQRRSAIAKRYFSFLAGRSDIQLPATPAEGAVHAWHLFVIRLRPERTTTSRKALVHRLRQAGLGVNVHYIPIHLHPYYRERFGTSEGEYPEAEACYAQAVTLPLYPALTDSEVEEILNITVSALDAVDLDPIDLDPAAEMEGVN